ncbi:MAG: hypothetical protein D6729_08325 [Deltaproteobacteria bacterium]|nr:MAG: hypothetical protein D6729_08325 [Deltaproteobacteria bacterium]
MGSLSDRRLLLVVTGGVAAYKAAFLARLLLHSGATVRVSMTRAAQAFVGKATFEALTGHAVLTDLFDGAPALAHIELARWAEVAVVAPATAHFLAKMAHGLADDAPSTVLLALRAPVFVAPAMNDGMWEHPATQANIETLEARGVRRVGPVVGPLAEGYEAVGRMAEPEAILEAVARFLGGRGT